MYGSKIALRVAINEIIDGYIANNVFEDVRDAIESVIGHFNELLELEIEKKQKEKILN